jgi:uncharacterized membrane protein YfcA
MDALEVIAVLLWAFVVSLVGGLVGLVLGNLRLPIVVLFATSPAAGAGANVGISGAAAIASASRHARSGRVNWQLFGWMAPPSLIGTSVQPAIRKGMAGPTSSLPPRSVSGSACWGASSA